MAAVRRHIAGWEALMIRAQARFAALRHPLPAADGPTPDGCPGSDRPVGAGFAAEEIAAELHLSPAAAAVQLELAVTAVSRLPATLAALDTGDIDLGRLRATVEATAALSDEQAAAVEAKVLARGGRASHSLFRQALRRAVLAADPDGARRRQVQARRDRQVRVRPVEDGMAELWALLPAADAQAAYQRLDTLARRAASSEDSRVVDVGRRFPAPGLARLVHARDRTCRFPGCRKPARFCDLDHVRPYTAGGQTTEGNLLTVCRRHHRAKHEGGWGVTRAADGVTAWTGPTGRVYRSVPEFWENLDHPPPTTVSAPTASVSASTAAASASAVSVSAAVVVVPGAGAGSGSAGRLHPVCRAYSGAVLALLEAGSPGRREEASMIIFLSATGPGKPAAGPGAGTDGPGGGAGSHAPDSGGTGMGTVPDLGPPPF